MDILINVANGDIKVSTDEEEVAAFSDKTDPVYILETTLSALGYNVDTIQRDTEEEDIPPEEEVVEESGIS